MERGCMKKVFVLFLVLSIFTPLNIVSTEQMITEAPRDVQYQLTKTISNQLTDYTTIPERPLTSMEVLSYDDVNLTELSHAIPINTSLKITNLLLNEQLNPVFELSDGTYLPANQKYIISDVVMEEKLFEGEFWLEKGFTVYASPYYVGAKALSTKLQPYTKIAVIKEAQTLHGTYYYSKGQGWISDEFLSPVDNRIKKVQTLLENKYNKATLSISVTQTSTGLSAGINPDKIMYSASVNKLPLLYYVQKQLNQGKLSLTDKVKYTDKVHDFDGAFDPEGSGSISKIADNEEYTIEELMKKVAQESDNAATNILAYYATNQYGSDYQKAMSDFPKWDMEKREVSSKTAAQVMSAIYEQGGEVIDYLSHTRFDDQRISKDIDVQVAHKIGDAYDFRHDVAIVYTNEPFILSIFTENMSYDDISAIAKDVYIILR